MIEDNINKKYARHKLMVIFFIVAIAFFVGVLFGKYIESRDSVDVNRFMKNLELNSESFLVEQELLGSTEDCSLAEQRISSLSSELYELGVMLGEEHAEDNLGKDNYLLLKKKFHLMQIRTYMLYHTLKANCDTKDHVALFYYKKNDPSSKEQGLVLDELVKNYPLNVFAIEYNFTSELAFMEDYYKIINPPAVVVDYSKVFDGFASYEEIANTIT